MPVLKAPPKLIRNATIQVRVEEEVDIKLRKYAEFIDATPAFVVTESLKMLFNKDAEFREWFAQHAIVSSMPREDLRATPGCGPPESDAYPEMESGTGPFSP